MDLPQACCTRMTAKPRHRLFRRALAMRAIFCAVRYPCSRASMAAQATLTCALATRVASAQVTCLRHSSNGRPSCGTQKFPQEQRSSDVHRRRR